MKSNRCASAAVILAFVSGGCAVSSGTEEVLGTEAEAFIGPDDPPAPKRGPITPAPTLGVTQNTGGETVTFAARCGGNSDVPTLERRLRSAPNGWISIENLAICSMATDGTIQPDTEYCYRLASRNSDHIAYSSDVCFRTDRYRRAPEKPVLVRKTVTRDAIAFTVHDETRIETGYRLERGGPGEWRTIQTVGAQRGTDFTLRDDTVAAYSHYNYRIVAFNPWTSSAIEVAADSITTRPATPANLRAEATTMRSIDLAWSTSGSNEDGFRIHVSDGLFNPVVTVGAGVRQKTITTLLPDTMVCFVVEAFNEAGTALSDESCFRTAAVPATEEGVDLYFRHVAAAPESPSIGDPADGRATVCNRGKQAAGSFEWSLAVDGSAVASTFVSGLASGACITQFAGGAFPPGFKRGTTVLEFTADSQGGIPEASETNNTQRLEIYLP
jgi:hypothetical protein